MLGVLELNIISHIGLPGCILTDSGITVELGLHARLSNMGTGFPKRCLNGCADVHLFEVYNVDDLHFLSLLVSF